MTRPLVVRTGALPALDGLRWSRSALDRDLAGDAELSVIELTTEATVLGAFQRGHGLPSGPPLARRVSGGPFLWVGPGTLHVTLALGHPAALVACDARHIVNRYVRPLLRALTKRGALAHYFGRDWISVAHRPVGQVGFGHDSVTRRTVFEAFVASRAPFAPAGRASFRDKEPGTLESLTGLGVDVEALTSAIVAAYAVAADRPLVPLPLPFGFAAASREDEIGDDPPWAASVEEAIGEVAAGRDAKGALRLGGDVLASRDALDRVSKLVDALPDGADAAAIGAIVDRELTPTAVALDGVRDLASLAGVLARARSSA